MHDDAEPAREHMELAVNDFEFVPENIEQAIIMAQDSVPAIELSPSSFDELQDPADGSVFPFSLNPAAPAPTLDGQSASAIQTALDALDGYETGFLFVDMQTGAGYARNIDEDIYGASSFKAPLAAYILSNISDAQGISSWEEQQIVASVENSDNDSFVSLSNSYRHTQAFADWIESLSIDDSDGHLFSLGDYATYSARDAAKMWCFIYDYMSSGAPGAELLSMSTERTNVSFIRNGVERVVGSELVEWVEPTGEMYMAERCDAFVRNKAGWFPEAGTFASTSDNAIISVNGRDYMMCILCSAPAYGQYQDAVSELARALFAARICLVPDTSASE